MAKTQNSKMSDHVSRILETASTLFLEQGFDATSTDDIARGARISKRELYSHFKDKREVLREVIASLQQTIWSEMDVEWSSSDEVRSVLLNAGAAIHKRVSSPTFRSLFRIVASQSFQDPAAAQQFYTLGPGAGRKQTAKFMTRFMKAGQLREASPLKAADDFLDLMISAQHITALALGYSDRTTSMAAHVAHAVDVFLSYYSVQSKTGS